MNEFGFLIKERKINAAKRKLIILSLFLTVFFLFVNLKLRNDILLVITDASAKEKSRIIKLNIRLNNLKEEKKNLISDYFKEFEKTNQMYKGLDLINNIITDDFFQMLKSLSIFLPEDITIINLNFNKNGFDLNGIASKRKSITELSENFKKSGQSYFAVIKDERTDINGLIIFNMEIKKNE